MNPGPGLARLILGFACACLCAQAPPPPTTPFGTYSGLPKLFRELGSPAYGYEFIPGSTTRITFETEDPWGSEGERSLRVWAAALGLAHHSRELSSPFTPHLRLMPRGGTALTLVWESAASTSQLKHTDWSALLGPKSMPEAWWDTLTVFKAGWHAELTSMPGPALARLLHAQASGWKAPFLDSFRRPELPAANPCWPVRAIQAEIPNSERGKPKGAHPLVTWNREGVLGGVTSDFAPGYVGGNPKGLRVEVLVIKGSGPSHGWCVNAPRIFTQQLPYPNQTKVLPHSVVADWTETLQRRALGIPSDEPLLDRTPIQFASGLVLHIYQAQISDGRADLKGSVDQLMRYSRCIAQLFLGDVPVEATQAGSGHLSPVAAAELNASLCSWKGGYGVDFGPTSGGYFKGQLRFTVVTPDPSAYRQALTEALEPAGMSPALTFVGLDVHPLEDFLAPGPPRFMQFK